MAVRVHMNLFIVCRQKKMMKEKKITHTLGSRFFNRIGHLVSLTKKFKKQTNECTPISSSSSTTARLS